MSAQSSSNGATPVLRPIIPIINQNLPAKKTACEVCFLMTHTIDGIYRLMTNGYLHHYLRWTTHNDIAIPPKTEHDMETKEDDVPSSPTLPLLNQCSPFQFTPPPLGDDCPVCSAALSAPEATQKGTEILHRSVLHKYKLEHVQEDLHFINFRAITSNTAG